MSKGKQSAADLAERKIIEDFIADVRKICLIYGSQARAAQATGMDLRSISRWFSGYSLPTFHNYLMVKRVLAMELDKIKQDDEANYKENA